MESMTNAPYYSAKMRGGARLMHVQMEDGIIKDGLWDACGSAKGGQHMGDCAELCAADHSITREEQDAFAAESYRRAAQAAADGKFTAEIAPVEIKGRRGKPSTFVTEDEEATRASTLEVLTKMRPCFKSDGGTVTAGNASTISDGAAALVLMSRKKAIELGVVPIATFKGMADAARKPEDFTIAPALAIPQAMKHAGVDASQVDLYEINEAFAVVSLANCKLLSLDPTKVNIYGGAVAMGHPLGCSGARIIVTLISALQQEGKKCGVAGICNGGGGASAVVVQLD
jgi:acetyl-CoA C-acetyltransferase